MKGHNFMKLLDRIIAVQAVLSPQTVGKDDDNDDGGDGDGEDDEYDGDDYPDDDHDDSDDTKESLCKH